MKNQCALLFFLALAACTFNNVQPEKRGVALEQPEKWQLVEMSGNIANVPPATGNNMTWQEWYVLYPDHSFTKTRVRDNITTSANGSYSVISSDKQYLELMYPSDNTLIGNCTAEAKELFAIFENKIVSTWSMCDGPGLTYKKVKIESEPSSD